MAWLDRLGQEHREKDASLRILFVAFADSIHTARWIAQIIDCGWDIHLFPSVDGDECHPALRGVTIHHALYTHQGSDGNSHRGIYIGWRRLYRFLNSDRPAARGFRKLAEIVWKVPLKDGRADRLEKLISQLRPDIVHSLETQHAGYLVMEARKRMGEMRFPAWIHTNWGSDIYLFGRLPQHTPRIKELLSLCEYYACECNRDVVLARQYGFRGTVAIVAPDTGGFDFAGIREMLPSCPKTSERKAIMLKGYQGWSGRALVGIRALARVKDLLNGYHVYIHSSNHTEDIQIAAELLSQDAGVPVTVLEKLPHKESGWASAMGHHSRCWKP